MGRFNIDPRQDPGEPWLRRLIEFMRRAGAERLDTIYGRETTGGEVHSSTQACCTSGDPRASTTRRDFRVVGPPPSSLCPFWLLQ